MGNAQEQALGAKTFRQNQALFWWCTSVDREIKKQIIPVVLQVSLSPHMDQLTGFGQEVALKMLQHIFRSYRAIDKIYLKENAMKMMGGYDLSEPLSCIIGKLEKGR